MDCVEYRLVKKKALLHSCCGPCASACIPRLKGEGFAVTMYFANSNIDTYEEYLKRLEAAKVLADAEGVELIAEEYNHDEWLDEVAAGFENEPEKGVRCERCFRYNLAKTAAYLESHDFDLFCTSLTVSPHKPSLKIFAATEHEKFEKFDFKKKEGFKLSVSRSAQLGLYRQSYCGCEYSKRRMENKKDVART